MGATSDEHPAPDGAGGRLGVGAPRASPQRSRFL